MSSISERIERERNRLNEIRRGIEELKKSTKDLLWQNHPNIAVDEIRERQGLAPLNDADRERIGLPSKESSEDGLRQMINRTQQGPPKPVDFDSVREKLGLKPLDPKTREKLGLTE